ncbi:MAG: type II and III secretion system protein [Acidobacteria bacterium]|nr:type II and III secretion system protein [Acidobacteriota bacterium]MBS1866942.1 type II and III secretion system protein [Acidobacteriota bacterium]
MRRWGNVILCVGIGLVAAGCPKGGNEYNQARKSENLQDLDTALQYYQKAYNADPRNAAYRIKLNQIRFEASAYHVKQGQKLRDNGDLRGAAAEFQRAATIDPSNDAAMQEMSRTLSLIAEKNRAADTQASATTEASEDIYASAPPELKPLSNAPINLKATDDAKAIFTAIAKLAGVNVIFDTDFTARRISVDLNNVTLEQALAITGIQSKAWWKPVTENMIFVIPDTTQKHRDYDETVVKTFYLSNVTQPQDLTDIANGLRQVAEIKKIQQLNSQNAIIVRDTPDKIAIAEKLIADIDKARPEVVIQVEVLSASTDRLRDLGVLPGQSASLQFNPPTSTTNTGGTGTGTGTGGGTTSNPLSLKGFHFSTADYSVTLPGATANFILTDTATKIIQNPEIRSIDGQPAKLRIGSRVPIATGSFQAGVGVGTTAVNPLVNTQFTYLDVGVNVDITPHIHPNHEVSMKVAIEVSQVTGQAAIGGINQPIIGSNKIEHDIRLREGETSVLGGLFQQIDSNTLNGIPGLSQIPFLQYLVSDKKKDHQESDVLITLTPRIVRLPDWTKANLRPILSGSEQQVQVKRENEIRTPSQQPVSPAGTGPAPNGAAGAVPANTNPSAPMGGDASASRVRFEPGVLSLKVGESPTIGIAVDNVTDLFSIPMMIQYDPNVISIEEVQHGAFLSGGNQEIAIVQRVDAEHGQAIISATRQPNTPGVSGSGTLLGLKIKAKAPGNTKISIVQVNARDSQQKGIPLVTGEATIQVQP